MIEFGLARFFALIGERLTGNGSHVLVHYFDICRHLLHDALLLLLSRRLHASVVERVHSRIRATGHASSARSDSLAFSHVVFMFLILNLHIRLKLLLLIKYIYILI